MKTTHNYTVGTHVHQVNFKSGTIQEWVDRLGEARALYFLHTWACAHTGQSWFKKLAERAAQAEPKQGSKEHEDWQDATATFSAIVNDGVIVDIIGLMPKEQQALHWTASLMNKLTKAGGPLSPAGKELMAKEKAGWTAEQKAEWVEFVSGL